MLILPMTAVQTGESIDQWLAGLLIPGEPARVDLFSRDQLRHLARCLADSHQTAATQGRGDRLRARFEENARVLAEAQRVLSRVAVQKIHSAGVWFLDNYYLVHEQIRIARQLLPHQSSRNLSRIYDLVLELVSHSDGQIDQEELCPFIAAYQESAPLKLGELWAIPIMLRLALIENMRRIAVRIVYQLRQHWGEPSPSFDGETQAADLFFMSNSITSLRAIRALDWKAFVEEQSHLERQLRQDPQGIYGRMSFASRDVYRHVIEALARRSSLSEPQIAQTAVELATQASPHDRTGHVGYYLVDAGRPVLEERIGYRRAWWESLFRAVKRYPLAVYLGTMLTIWMIIVTAAVLVAWQWGMKKTTEPVVMAILFTCFASAASQCAVTLTNWLCTLIVRPRPIFRLDFSQGIPAAHAALVVVPTLLTDSQAAQAMVEQLETRYLANRDPHLQFALLTDLPDADREVLSADQALLEQVCQGIERLNQQYCAEDPQQFFLLHRSRKWNAAENRWMGEERKRGKLADLNRLLRTGDAAAFSTTVGDLTRLSNVQYVITLDTDTWLPRDAAQQLVGCMAHPLNRPQIDPATRLVVEGYGILQPRVSVSVPEAQRSPYSRLFAGESGIDPYTHETSDVYQDLFGQGSFIGKGIYDVHAFAAALEGRLPHNRVLSHDLIEGCFARGGLIDDLELFEGCPARFLADMSRRHRWIRGDWQIAAWLSYQNPLSWLSRWKIFDNLRRSLCPLFLLGFVIAGWILAPAGAALWAFLAMALVFGTQIFMALPGMVRNPHSYSWRCLQQEAFAWCVLPYTVHCHLDAILRTLYRVFVSRRGLLEWTTASEAESRSRTGCRDHYELMWACTIAGLSMGAALAIVNPWSLLFAGPALLAWLVGPGIAWWISRTTEQHPVCLTAVETAHFRRWARQTWHYFDTWLTIREHWLLPDNVQENGSRMIAHRTSPTNIGMGLLADLAAYDLGYLPLGEFLRRCHGTLHTLLRLERHRGHFFNWYDTRTLRPIEPCYVSSVDSGNLWGTLIVLQAGLSELADCPLVSPRLVAGLQDTLGVIAAVRKTTSIWPKRAEFDTFFARLQRECDQAQVSRASDAWELLGRVSQRADDLAATVPEHEPGLQSWCRALVRQCHAFRHDLSRFAFWLHVPARADFDQLDANCTLRELQQLPPFLAAVAQRSLDAVREQLQQISALIELCEQFSALDFRFLLHPQWKLLTVGFDVRQSRRDNSFYDLLASESRLASFLAVSHGQLPQEHWFLLGRMVTLADGQPTLLSWSGSMFEYLMPLLIMPSHPTTILDVSCSTAVRQQIQYAVRRGIPWGISESCYHSIDANQTYRYHAFGIPELGLDRDQGADGVIAPYASALAAMIAPREACANLLRLEQQGALSPVGFYDALDYTPSRCLSTGEPAICRTVMSHHSGMTLLAFSHVLLDGIMTRRFLKNPHCRAHDLLLQERLPQVVRPVEPVQNSEDGFCDFRR